jgi:hypothetical protein
MMRKKAQKAQAALDMLISYGIAILIISIAIYVVLQLGIFNNRLAPTYCNAAPSFICDGVSINTTGEMTIIFAQSTGGTLNITGIACSNLANTTSIGPKYGNFNVSSYKKAPQFYPTSQLQNGLILYSSNQTRLYVYCYSGPSVAKSNLGNSYTGYVWINYTINTLPNNFHNVQQVISFSAKYT